MLDEIVVKADKPMWVTLRQVCRQHAWIFPEPIVYVIVHVLAWAAHLPKNSQRSDDCTSPPGCLERSRKRETYQSSRRRENDADANPVGHIHALHLLHTIVG